MKIGKFHSLFLLLFHSSTSSYDFLFFTWWLYNFSFIILQVKLLHFFYTFSSPFFVFFFSFKSWLMFGSKKYYYVNWFRLCVHFTSTSGAFYNFFFFSFSRDDIPSILHIWTWERAEGTILPSPQPIFLLLP